MRKQLFYIISFIFLGAYSILNAQEIQLKASLDTNVIKIGDQTHFRVQFSYPKNIVLNYNIAQDTICEKVEIINQKTDTLRNDSTKNQFLIDYTISSFDSGYYAIPPQMFVNLQKQDTLWTKALVLAVQTVAIDTTKASIYDIKEPLEEPWTFKEFLQKYYPFIIIALLIILLAYFLIKYFSRKKIKEEKPIIIPKEEAHIIALKELELLKEEKLWQNDRIKLYYTKLTNILRKYIENRYKISALEQTSLEIIHSLKQENEITKDDISKLKGILSIADIAKFAKVKPLANENDKCLKDAFLFVESTKKQKIESNNTTNNKTDNTPNNDEINKKGGTDE